MTQKTKSVCIVGAGFSGLCMATQLQKTFPSYNITIFDNNSDFGGTWLVNTYPGCACDVPSHLYSLSFEPNPYWSTHFASQVEILMYIKRIAEKHSLYEKALFRHQVQKLEWIEGDQKWKADVLDIVGKEILFYFFDFVFCGTGEYHLPKIPEIFMKFQGPMMHSAEWKSEIELEGKIVAVVGSGASAVQIIPNIVDKVGKLLSYQRTPAWVISRCQFNFPNCVQWAFAKIPGLRALFRKVIYFAHEVQYPAFRIDGILSHFARPIARLLGNLHLRKQIKNQGLRSSLQPNYTFGCNRVCLSGEYYLVLRKNNVELIRDEILDVTEDSIRTKDREDKVDVLILATGFHIHEYFGPLQIIGRNGQNILENWKRNGPSLYLGVLSNSMPNLFFVHGPGIDLGHNTGLITTELQVSWLIKMFQEMERKGFSVVSIKSSLEKEYVEERQHDMQKTIWSKNDCGTYYANNDGLITIMYPRSQIDYWYRSRKINPSNFDFS